MNESCLVQNRVKKSVRHCVNVKLPYLLALIEVLLRSKESEVEHNTEHMIELHNQSNNQELFLLVTYSSLSTTCGDSKHAALFF